MKAATTLEGLSHCNSFCLSVHHANGSVKNGTSYRITKYSSSAAWKTLVSGTVMGCFVFTQFIKRIANFQ